jgi:hypothetical protein
MQTSLDYSDKTKATGGNQMAFESTTKKPQYNTKKSSILKKFIELGDVGMTCFDAANRYHDYVLRSTVSDIQRDFGIQFARERIKVPNSFGKFTDCMRYWLDDFNRAKATNFLSQREAL